MLLLDAVQVAAAMALDRRSRKNVDASGFGGGEAGRSVLTELCSQLKGRLTAQMSGQAPAPVRVRTEEEKADKEAAMSDFSVLKRGLFLQRC